MKWNRRPPQPGETHWIRVGDYIAGEEVGLVAAECGVCGPIILELPEGNWETLDEFLQAVTTPHIAEHIKRAQSNG